MTVTPKLHQFRAKPVDRFAAGAGVRLHYLEWGSGPATLLFLHGRGLNAHTFDVVCDLLHDRFRSIVLDFRGHGDSDWSPDGMYPLEAHVRDVEALVDALGLRRFVLVGMSLGGGVAIDYAAKHQDLLTGLVIVDSGPEIRPVGSQQTTNFMTMPSEADTLDDFIDRAIAFNPLRTREQLRLSLMNSLRQTADGRWAWKYDRRVATGVPDGRTPEELAAERARGIESLWKAARTIASPTLVVRGAKSDRILDEDAIQLVEAVKHGRWIKIEGAGHVVQGDRPYELAAALEEFVAKDATPR